MRLVLTALGLSLGLSLGCASNPPPPPPPPAPPPAPTPMVPGYYLLARDGYHGALKGWGQYPHYEQVVETEKQRLAGLGITPQEVWASETLNPAVIDANCIPPGDAHGMQFLEAHPWAKTGLQKWNVTALCQTDGCPDVNYLCVLVTSNAPTMQMAGYGQVK